MRISSSLCFSTSRSVLRYPKSWKNSGTWATLSLRVLCGKATLHRFDVWTLCFVCHGLVLRFTPTSVAHNCVYLAPCLYTAHSSISNPYFPSLTSSVPSPTHPQHTSTCHPFRNIPYPPLIYRHHGTQAWMGRAVSRGPFARLYRGVQAHEGHHHPGDRANAVLWLHLLLRCHQVLQPLHAFVVHPIMFRVLTSMSLQSACAEAPQEP